jgi:tetratricopeptide (TPR) repeat protein
MNTRAFFRNSDFLEYARLLSELHRLIRQGTDESPEGEALRDRMDGSGSRLSSDEVASLNGISADFYSLAESSTESLTSQAPDVQADLRAALEARDRRDFGRSLDLLRKRSAYINPAVLSYVRGSVWGEAGEDLIAVEFFQRAAELEPGNTNYLYMVLHHLSRADPASAVDQANRILADRESSGAGILLKAADIIFQSTREKPLTEARPTLESLIPIFEQVIVRLETSGEGTSNPALLAAALSLAGFASEHLDLTDRARDYYDRGLLLFPNNDALLVARGILLYGRETERSVRDFETALHGGSMLVWPYFYLAHHALLNNQFEACLADCNRALRLPASKEVQARLLEWTAISQASLGHPPRAVEGAFQAAQELAPDDERIARNYQTFRESSNSAEVGWEKVSEHELRILGERRLRLAA